MPGGLGPLACCQAVDAKCDDGRLTTPCCCCPGCVQTCAVVDLVSGGSRRQAALPAPGACSPGWVSVPHNTLERNVACRAIQPVEVGDVLVEQVSFSSPTQVCWTVLVPMLLETPDPIKRSQWQRLMYNWTSYNVGVRG